MLNKRAKLVFSFVLTVGIMTAFLSFGDAFAQGPTASPSATNTLAPKAPPPAATATQTTAPTKPAPATATSTKVPPTATTVASATATKAAATATATKPAATATRTATPVVRSVRAVRSGGPPGGGFYSGHTIMNLGGSTANVNVTVYDSASSNTYNITNTVASGASWTFLSDASGFSPSIPSSFQGSAVVSSDQPVESVVNITNLLGSDGGVSGGTAAEQYDGWDGTKVGTTVSFPLAKNAFGPKSTSFYIQNVGSSSATFTAVFKMGSGISGPFTPYTYTSPSLSAGQMAVIVPGDTTTPSAVPPGQIGSLTVTSSQNLAGTSLEYETSTSPALILQSTDGVAPTDYDTTLYFPTFKKSFGGRSTGLNIQNVTGSAISVTVTYYGSGACAGTYVDSAVNVNSGALAVFLDPAVVPSSCLGSAKAVGTGNIAATVNESFIPCSGCTQASTTYSAFPSHEATHHFVAPLYKQQLGCKYTGLQIQNLDPSTTASATAVFNVGGTTYTLNSISISPNSSVVLIDVNTNIPPGSSWSGSPLPNSSLASVNVTAAVNIVGIANEAVYPSGGCSGVVQNKKNYEGFNITP